MGIHVEGKIKSTESEYSIPLKNVLRDIAELPLSTQHQILVEILNGILNSSKSSKLNINESIRSLEQTVLELKGLRK